MYICDDKSYLHNDTSNDSNFKNKGKKKHLPQNIPGLHQIKTLQHRLLFLLITQLWDCNRHYDQLQKACTLSEDTKGY